MQPVILQAAIDEKMRLTLPARVARELALTKGAAVEFFIEEREGYGLCIVLCPVPREKR